MGKSKTTIRFKENNKILYMQDHSFFEGVPAGIDFEIENVRSKLNNYSVILKAPGYGCLDGRGYGNGKIYASGIEVVTMAKKALGEPVPLGPPEHFWDWVDID